MYQGVIKEKQDYKKTYFRTKILMLSNEQVERNGVITNEIAFKTQDFTTDKNIRYRDFDILNLKAINALGELKEVQLTPSNEKIEKAAGVANEMLDQMEIIQEIEKGSQN